MNTPTALIIPLMLAAGLGAGPARATLFDRGGGLIYDDVLDITWLQNANFASDVFGWPTAASWIASFGYYDSVRNVYLVGWRLPKTSQPDATCESQSSDGSYGYGCIGSEMGHLFYEDLGGQAGQDITYTHNANYSLFENIQGSYWSDKRPNSNLAWAFSMGSGYQGTTFTNFANYLSIWPVRDGDVAAIPEPEVWGLMLTGLSLIGWARSKRSVGKA